MPHGSQPLTWRGDHLPVKRASSPVSAIGFMRETDMSTSLSLPKIQLDLKGLAENGPIHRSLAVAQLVEMSLRRGETTLASNGALVALTGNRTGRSPADKFIVREPSSDSRIAWGSVNQPMDPRHFQGLYTRVIDYFKGRDVFVFDGFAGADPAHRLPL
jgi:phosphoenolpyruvate carboxykinase (ATP)